MSIICLFLLLTLGVGQMWGAAIPAGTVIYVDVTNFTGGNASGNYYLSLVTDATNKGCNVNKTNTSGAGTYVPKNDVWTYKTLTKVKDNIYMTTISATQSDGTKFSIWAHDQNSYDKIWATNMAGNITYDGTHNMIVISSGSTKHNDRNTYFFNATWSNFPNVTAAPSDVVSGTNVMFYIQSYSGTELALNDGTVGTSHCLNATSVRDAYAYISIAKTNRTKYNRITNNRSGWTGVQNTGINSANGGELFVGNASTSTTPAKTATTTASVSSETLSISTTTNATTGVYCSIPLYIQYYIDNSFVGVTYNASTANYGSIPAGGATARASTYDVSSLTNGSHTLKTVLTDGIIYWVADEDNFDVAHTYTITYKDQGNVAYSGSNSGSLPSNYTYGVGASLVPGEKAGYSFGGWYTAPDCSSGLTTSISTSASGNKTFYAKWTLEPGVSLSAASATLNIGQTVRLTATGSNASNITKYDFYEGSTKIGTVSTSSTSATYDYTPTTTGSKTMKVIMTYNSGSSTITSSNVVLSINTPSVATLTETSSTTEMWIGENPTGALTFSATSNNVGSGASVTWSISDASGGTFTQTSAGSYSGKSWTYTPVSTGSKTITVTMTVGGNNYTKTYNLKVYERWNIYVHNNCKWAGGVALYMWNGSGSNAVWPGAQGTGTGCEIYNGNWYVVTLDSKYDNFILDNNQASSGIEQCNDAAMNKVTYAPGTFWEFIWDRNADGKKYYNLTAASLSDPTVVLDAGESTSYVINTNQIYFTGHITNYGGDGSAAADMIEVGFELNGTKYPMTCKEGDDTRFFWGYVTGLTAGTTYTVKAYATNIHGTGKSSGTSFTTRATGTTTIKVRSAVGRTAPYIYAYTETDAGCNGTTTYNAAAPGVAMTKVITGTVYNWYEYDISNEFNKFRISENGSNKTDDWESPAEATCYYYHPTEATQGNRLGTMACPSAIPQLMINGGGSSEEFTYYDMSSGGVNQITKTLSLAAKTGYLFKPVYNAEWYGKASTNITRAANSVNGLDAAVEDNLYMTTDAAGDYTFTFNTSTKALTITYPTAYTITYGAGTINGSNSAISVSPSFDSGDYVLAETDVTVSKGTTKTGYTWKGWYSNTGGTGEAWSTTDANLSLTATRASNISVYACYTYTNYTITYNLNGGSNPVSPAPATSYTIASSTITLPTPTRTGYTFGGWKINSNLSGDSYTTIPSGSTGNKVYYAKWTANNYTVTLHEQGATTSGTPGDGGTITMTYDATNNIKDGEGAAIQIITTLPIKTGHVFGGYWNSAACNDKQLINATGYYNWNVSGYIDGTTNTWVHADNVDLYAKWTPKQCTINFDFDATDPGHGSHASATTSTTATYAAAMPSVTPPTAANGYAFMGYYDAADGTGTKYYNADGSSANNWAIDTEETTTLYAYYKKAEITAITLNSSILDPVDAGETGWVIANPTVEPTPVLPVKICWELLYDNDNPVPAGHEAQAYAEEGKPNQVRFSIAGLAASRYKIKATLRTGSSCDGGTELSTFTQTFTIASSFTVTILYQDDDNNNIAPGTTSPGKATDWTTISAPDIFGYSFVGWTLGEGITTEDLTDKQNDFRFKASYYGTIVAKYEKNQYIYLDLSQTFSTYGKWDNPYVYFYNGDPWVNDKGAGAKDGDKTHTHYISGHAMTKIDGTDIWYFDYGGVSGATRYVAFTWGDKTMQENFNSTDVIFRGDFSESTPLFVPATDGTPVSRKTDVNGAQYYNKGYWVSYLGEPTGYTLLVYNSAGDVELKREPFIAADKRMTMTSTVQLDASSTYKIEVLRNDGYWYKAASNFTASSLGAKPILPDGTKNAIQTNADGIYTFTLGYLSGNLQLSVVYPSSIGDFRIAYTDNATWSHSHTLESWILPSKTITHRANGIDTVSFFISKGAGITPKIRWEKVTSVSTSSVTWGSTSSWLTTGYTDVDEAGVYNFKVTQNADGTSIASIERIGAYDGSYYIRCNALRSKWDHYTIDSDHRMTYSEFSESAANSFGEKYSHYKAKWCPRNTNIAFVIANDYSPCLTDKLTTDVGGPAFNNLESDGTLRYEKEGENMKYNDASAYLDKYSANVRFMWNRKTNKTSRAYVSAATSTNAKFLVLQGSGMANSNIYNGTTGAAFTADSPGANSVILKDDQNWIYEEVIKANPSALVKLYANYCDQTQWFRGADGTSFTKDDNAIELLGGSSSSSKYAVRVIYDFKTNRLVCAWMPEGASQEIETNLTVNADVMVVREHQGSAQCITFANDKSMTGVKTVYGAMKFNRWILSNRAHPEDTNPDHCRESNLGADLAEFHPVLPIGQQLSIYERSLYFISFPFNVKASEIFGFGHYWDEWYLEYYDGETRAKNGYWKDSPANWKYVTPDMLEDFTLKANEGYILGLDLDFMKVDNTTFWSNGISTVELYFPSTVNLETLQQTNVTIPALSSDYKCTINRGTPEGDRRVKDSYWRCLGVPSFNIYNSALKDGSGTTIEWKTDYTWHADESEFPFIYMWNKADNTLTPQATSTFTFLPMHAYLVQNGGTIHWTAVSAKPSSIVARRADEQPQKEYNWDLTLVCDSQLIDRTYIRMSNLEQVTDSFDFGQDLNKEFNSNRSDIYTYIGYEKVAANSMPIQTEQTTIVAVGVKINTAGEYTFAMPDTYGVDVTLIDTETGVRTHLGLMDYTVTLAKGDYTNRFILEISPVSNTPTDIELINGENGDASLDGVRKVLIENKLFLIKGDKVYDATGRCIN